MQRSAHLRFDLLAWRPLRAALRSRAFPLAFQVAALAGVLALAWNGLGVGGSTPPEALLTLRKTNLTTLFVWGLWWPGLIVATLLLGRVWCTVCPMELASRLGDALARRLGWPRARLGRLARAGWWVVGAYLALQLLVAGVSLHRVPQWTAVLLLTLLGGAFLAGLVFRAPRSFCRSLCPAGALLSVYGRSTPFQLTHKDDAVCSGCATRDCTADANRHRLDARSCPSLLRPYRRDPSDGCVLCLQCAKVCPHGNVGLGIATDIAPVRRRAALRPFEAAFVLIALGFVAHETTGEVKALDAVFHAVPAWLQSLVPAVPFGWFEALWFLAGVPVLIAALMAAVGYAAGHRGGLGALLVAGATGAAPVVALAHAAKAIAKIGGWGGYVPLALRDPSGLRTASEIGAGVVAAPGALYGLPLVAAVVLVAMSLVGWRAWRSLRRAPDTPAPAARVGLATAAVLFSTILVVWTTAG